MDSSRAACARLHPGFSGHLYLDFIKTVFLRHPRVQRQALYQVAQLNIDLPTVTQRKILHSSKPIVSSCQALPGAPVPCESPSCQCHNQANASAALCSWGIRLCCIEKHLNLLTCKMGIRASDEGCSHFITQIFLNKHVTFVVACIDKIKHHEIINK